MRRQLQHGVVALPFALGTRFASSTGVCTICRRVCPFMLWALRYALAKAHTLQIPTLRNGIFKA